MQQLTDPETLQDRTDIEFVTQTTELDREEYEEARENVESFDSHVVVGVNDESGDILLVDDGHHGWTLPAFPFETGADCVAVGRQGVEDILGVDVDVQSPVRMRRIEYLVEDDPKARVYNVVLRAVPVSSDDVLTNPEAGAEDLEAAGWFDEVPDDATESVADDARLFLD